MKDESVFITGINSQDGSILASSFLSQGWSVHGTVRRTSGDNLWRLEELGVLDRILLHEWSLEDPYSIHDPLRVANSSRIFHMAAESFTHDSFRRPHATLTANVLGTVGLLEAVRKECPQATVVIASSSEIFGRQQSPFTVDESSVHRPTNPYGVSKSAATQLGDVYRHTHGLRVRSALLFNHESPWRGTQFVTRKISSALARMVVLDDPTPIRLGNLWALRDWGSAEEYVRGMMLLSEAPEDTDVIFATGEKFSVFDWLRACGREVGLSLEYDEDANHGVCIDRPTGRVVATVDSALLRSDDLMTPDANTTLATRRLAWRPRLRAPQIASSMIRSDVHRLESGWRIQ